MIPGGRDDDVATLRHSSDWLQPQKWRMAFVTAPNVTRREFLNPLVARVGDVDEAIGADEKRVAEVRQFASFP